MSKRALLAIVVIGSMYLVRGLIVTVAYPATLLNNPIVIVVGIVVAVCAYFYLQDD
jgi:hypothetical protein